MKRLRVMVVLCCLFGSTISLGALTTTRPAAATQRAAVVETLIEEGMAALDNNDAKAARDAFDDALQLDPSNALASQGLALAYLRLSLPARAVKILQPMAARKSSDRAIVLNYAAACVGAKQPMPGVKLLKDFMQTSLTDQEAADAMQIALNSADQHARQSRLYEEAGAFLQAYLLKLSSSHPGEKYWGVQWIPANEADAHLAAVTAAQKHVETLREQTSQGGKQVVALQNQIAATERNGHTLAELDKEKGELTKAQDALAAKQKERDEAIAAIPHPDIPGQITTVLIGVAAATVAVEPRTALMEPPRAIASANPPVAPANAPTAPIASGASPPVPPIQPTPPRFSVRHAACFAVSCDLVVTSAEVVADAQEIRVQTGEGADVVSAVVVKTDESSGLALLKVQGPPLPYLPIASAFQGGAVNCVGFPDVRLFGGQAELISGAAKSTGIASLSRHPRLPGAPLIVNGHVVSVELASRDQEPSAISIVTFDQLAHFLEGQSFTGTPATDARAAVMELTARRIRQ